MKQLPILRLKKNEERRLNSGHLWIFSNEVDTDKTPLTDFEPGCEVTVLDYKGMPIGSATVNPSTLIAARLHSRRPDVCLNAELIEKRLKRALILRSQLFERPWYRLCHGEGDLMPGLVLDRYGDHLTIQITTLAMEKRKDAVCEVLAHLLKPVSILFDNSVAVRALEGLTMENQSLGLVPETLEVPENGCLFTVPILSGQKTGWFYDQRENRSLASAFARGKTVLDVFSYVGGFGVTLARSGAKKITFIDASKEALGFAQKNLEKNVPGLSHDLHLLAGEAREHMGKLVDEGLHFDIVSLDPPAFIKRRKDVSAGLQAYRRLHELALRLLAPDGILISSSCSFHLTPASHIDCVHRAARKQNCQVQILALGRQGPDHPELLGMPETAYLKCCIARILS